MQDERVVTDSADSGDRVEQASVDLVAGDCRDRCDANVKLMKFDASKHYPDAVNVLRYLLTRAERGEVIGVAAVFVLSGRTIAHTYTQGVKDNIFVTLGALDHLRHRIHQDIEEENR